MTFRMTEEERARHQERIGSAKGKRYLKPAELRAASKAKAAETGKGSQDEAKPAKTPQNATQRMQALGRLKQGQMNKTEAAYAAWLESEKQAGRVVWFAFEALKFRLADATFYTPDFAVQLASGELQAHEVKGHWIDDARAKIKIAAELFPVAFIAVQAKAKKDGGGWSREVFAPD